MKTKTMSGLEAWANLQRVQRLEEEDLCVAMGQIVAQIFTMGLAKPDEPSAAAFRVLAAKLPNNVVIMAIRHAMTASTAVGEDPLAPLAAVVTGQQVWQSLLSLLDCPEDALQLALAELVPKLWELSMAKDPNRGAIVTILTDRLPDNAVLAWIARENRENPPLSEEEVARRLKEPSVPFAEVLARLKGG